MVYIPLEKEEVAFMKLKNWGDPALRITIPRKSEAQ